MKAPLAILLTLLLFACSSPSTVEEEATKGKETIDTATREDPFASSIEKAHEKEAFLDNQFISFDILLTFGGTERLNARVTLSTDSRKGRFDLNNGERIIYNDGEVFYSDSSTSSSRARFAAYTWSYFFLFPYKLSDPGTVWTDYDDDTPISKKSLAKKLTFESGTGDAPDDWYIVYSDDPSGLLDVAAYIVTAGATVGEAEEDPHAIEYDDYIVTDGVPIASRWTFWSWREEKGLVDTLGKATLSNFQFEDVADSIFTPNESDLIAD